MGFGLNKEEYAEFKESQEKMKNTPHKHYSVGVGRSNSATCAGCGKRYTNSTSGLKIRKLKVAGGTMRA